ncbi:tetratricopeptide repeat-containing glycosyltransferase family 2 protein [Heyndrickxia acidiproducens]|uniref:tetratricopeptide repeat-containing glycosyltransferase family 2 protein n=1 Tax=Heyndrickxia acidiproducens TaxID=1121084 RepID=UPI0003756B37|nr:glycosyltransferase family 2 protein [Heyndrickxia acidiproducens]
MRPFISLCMIVKNEEKVLNRCLDSVKDSVDEIVIVDTGSTDRTKEIAAAYTSKVYDFEWTDSFADARNFAQSKALGQWIFVLDADEYVEPENLKQAVRDLKESTSEIDAVEIKLFNFTGIHGESIIQHHSIRLYKNDPFIGYKRTIHEQLVKTKGQLKTKGSSLIIYHSGYIASVVKEKDKNKRNKKLLEKELGISRNKAFDYFNLGNEYLSTKEVEKALKSYIKAYQGKADIRYSWVSFCLVQIINCLIQLNRYQDALNVIQDSMTIYSQSPDLKFFKGYVFAQQKRFDDAIEELEDLLSNKEQYSYFLTSIDYLEYRPHQLLGTLYEKKGNKEKAITHFAQALNINHHCDRSFVGLLEILIQHESDHALSLFLDQHEFMTDSNHLNKLIAVLVANSKFELAEKYINLIENNELLKAGFKMKSEFVQGNDLLINKFIESNTFENLNQLIVYGCFDIYDLILFCIRNNDKKIAQLLYMLIQEPEKKHLMDVFFSNNKPKTINHDEYLTLIKKTLKYKMFDLFAVLAEKADLYPSIYLPTGHLLYQFGFKKEAMNIYENLETVQYENETFVDIISYYKEHGDYLRVAQWIIQALTEDRMDFRIFESALQADYHYEGLIDWDIHQIWEISCQYYPNSSCLTKRNHMVEEKRYIQAHI